jgi:hypothetical protein
VGPRVVLDTVVKGKILSPCWEFNPRNTDRVSRSQSPYRLSHLRPARTATRQGEGNMQQMQSDVMNRAELIQTCCVACQISSPVCSEGSLPGCKAAEA